MLDVVVISYPKTLNLVKVLFESFACHYKGDGQLYIFAEEETLPALQQMTSSHSKRVSLVNKKEHFPDYQRYSGYLTQQYFKLIAHRIVRNPYYLIVDDDFVFIRPTSERHLFCQDKPLFFYQAWHHAGKAKIWKEPAERFLGLDSPWHFLCNPTWVWDREIVAALEKFKPFLELFTLETFAEQQIYGTFAHSKFHDRYVWIRNYWGHEAVAFSPNQVPPEYLQLDPTICYFDFRHFQWLHFWSHWSRCEAKMREFFEESR